MQGPRICKNIIFLIGKHRAMSRKGDPHFTKIKSLEYVYSRHEVSERKVKTLEDMIVHGTCLI